jgi:SH3-like domain-containing protein
MNVRSGPGSSYKVVGNLPNQDVDGIVVHITGSSGDWVRIDRADQQGGDEERKLFGGEGWVHGPLLGVDGVGWESGGTRLYREPSRKSRVLARMQAGGEGGTVRGCRGKWMYVEHKKVRGWAAPGTICSNSLTNCN